MSAAQMQAPGWDGVIPILRFAFNLDAHEPFRSLAEGTGSGGPVIELDPGSKLLVANFVRRKDSSNPGIQYEVQFSDDLKTWSKQPKLLSASSIDAIWERVRYADTGTSGQFRFCRVVVLR